MDIFAVYATDEGKEEDGVLVFLVEGQEDIAKDPWIKVARYGNTAFNEAVQSSHRKLQVERKALKLSDKEVEIRGKNTMVEILARHILKSFGNLEFQDTKLQPGYEANLQLLRVKDFREFVVQQAMNMDLYRAEAAQEDRGNSQAA